MAPASSRELFDIQVNYRVAINSETHMWHDSNIQSVPIIYFWLGGTKEV